MSEYAKWNILDEWGNADLVLGASVDSRVRHYVDEEPFWRTEVSFANGSEWRDIGSYSSAAEAMQSGMRYCRDEWMRGWRAAEEEKAARALPS